MVLERALVCRSLAMVEKWKKSVDKVAKICALLTDSSKAFDYLDNKSLIAKLNAHVSEAAVQRYSLEKMF